MGRVAQDKEGDRALSPTWALPQLGAHVCSCTPRLTRPRADRRAPEQALALIPCMPPPPPPPPPPPLAHPCVHTPACTPACAHPCVHTRMRAHTHALRLCTPPACTPACVRTHTRRARARRPYAHPHDAVRAHAHACARMHTCALCRPSRRRASGWSSRAWPPSPRTTSSTAAPTSSPTRPSAAPSASPTVRRTPRARPVFSGRCGRRVRV